MGSQEEKRDEVKESVAELGGQLRLIQEKNDLLKEVSHSFAKMNDFEAEEVVAAKIEQSSLRTSQLRERTTETRSELDRRVTCLTEVVSLIAGKVAVPLRKEMRISKLTDVQIHFQFLSLCSQSQ